MRARNLVLIGAAALVLALGGVVWWVYASRDTLVKYAIEHFGSQITGVSVSVSQVKLEPAEGKGLIAGLLVGNPKGYDTPNAFALEEVRLVLDVATLTSGVVRIKEITIQAPVVTREGSRGNTNLDAIQKHVNAQAGKGGGEKKKTADSSGGTRFIIDHVYVRDAKVNLGGTATLPVPDLHLRDIGKKSNGASAGEVVSSVLGPVVGSVVNVGGAAVDATTGAVRGVTNLFK